MTVRGLRLVPSLLLSLLLVVATACTALPPASGLPAEPGSAAPTGAQPEPTAAPDSKDTIALCPRATADLQRLIDFEHRYCLTYPAQYKVEKPNQQETLLLIDGLLDATHPRVHIVVEPAQGRTAEAAADELVAQFEGFNIERSEAQVAGQPAIVLDKLPGQDINRRVLFVYEDRLFSLYFSPADPAVEAYTDMEDLYMEVLSSFTVLPASAELPSDQVPLDCLTATANTQSLLDKDLAFCLLYPADFQATKPNPGEVVLFAGSLQDVTHPKVFIQVTDAQGRTAQQVADAIVAEFGQGIERSFGETIGYENAELLDNVPGQDLSRQVIAVRGDRVYTLIFVPSDEAQGDVYREMEGLYDLVLRSFRFLN